MNAKKPMFPKSFQQFILVTCCLLLPFFSWSQGRTDLWVMPDVAPWNIAHKVAKGETVFMLARRYHVPPAILADANGLTYNDGLKENSTVIVPLGAYNLQSVKPATPGESRTLYYKVEKGDDLYRISRHAGVSQKVMIQWNNLEGRDIKPGQILLVGWVLFDATAINNVPVTPVANTKPVSTSSAQPAVPPVRKVNDTPKYVMLNPATTPEPPIDTDTVETAPPAPAPASLEALYLEQTQNGENVVVEKGSAGFYKVTTNTKGVASIAFHNKAAKGSVIKVKNLNNGRYVFVKVLGPVPLTKQYHNCIIGLSDKVQAVLGVKDTKAFCELSYGGY
jgi:LysM repeat protein